MRPVRLHVIGEGQTEETFVNRTLVDYLGALGISSTDARRVETGRKKGIVFRGGMTTYQKVKNDLIRWMKEDNNPDSCFTTMFDLYRLPNDFPGFEAAASMADPYARVRHLEEAFWEDLDKHQRFVPYIQLHEFEALLFSDATKFARVFVREVAEIQELVAIRADFSTPEHIDDGEETAPSKRIIKLISAYAGAKATAGPLIASAIGVSTLIRECRHFREWLEKLARLPTDAG
ncbi:MAG: DUF4276 family protein [Thermodesulfobacteriota bacterium]